jgi:hypothetical protein
MAFIGRFSSDCRVRMSLVSIACSTYSRCDIARPSTTSTRSSKTGLSLRFSRTHTANSMIKALAMKGMRQPHAMTSS